MRQERRGDVAILTLANPAKRNALDPKLCDALGAALGALGPSGVRAAVLTGDSDQAFCSGFDLDVLAAHSAAGATIGESPVERLMNAVADCAVPVICALNGSAFGAGCELAVTCDVRVGHAGVKLGMPPARLGIMYGLRGLARFTALAGESRARMLFLSARTLDASEAVTWGLIDELAPADAVHDRALALADAVAALAPLAVQGMRRSFELLLRHRTELAPAATAELDRLRAQAWTSDDTSEAIRALAEKRKPTFRGM